MAVKKPIKRKPRKKPIKKKPAVKKPVKIKKPRKPRKTRKAKTKDPVVISGGGTAVEVKAPTPEAPQKPVTYTAYLDRKYGRLRDPNEEFSLLPTSVTGAVMFAKILQQLTKKDEQKAIGLDPPQTALPTPDPVKVLPPQLNFTKAQIIDDLVDQGLNMSDFKGMKKIDLEQFVGDNNIEINPPGKTKMTASEIKALDIIDLDEEVEKALEKDRLVKELAEEKERQAFETKRLKALDKEKIAEANALDKQRLAEEKAEEKQKIAEEKQKIAEEKQKIALEKKEKKKIIKEFITRPDFKKKYNATQIKTFENRLNDITIDGVRNSIKQFEEQEKQKQKQKATKIEAASFLDDVIIDVQQNVNDAEEKKKKIKLDKLEEQQAELDDIQTLLYSKMISLKKELESKQKTLSKSKIKAEQIKLENDMKLHEREQKKLDKEVDKFIDEEVDVKPKQVEEAEEEEEPKQADNRSKTQIKRDKSKLINEIYVYAEKYDGEDKNGKSITKTGVEYKNEFYNKTQLDVNSEDSLKAVLKSLAKKHKK
jgi:hypothetical protein